MAEADRSGPGANVEERMLAYQRECEERARREAEQGRRYGHHLTHRAAQPTKPATPSLTISSIPLSPSVLRLLRGRDVAVQGGGAGPDAFRGASQASARAGCPSGAAAGRVQGQAREVSTRRKLIVNSMMIISTWQDQFAIHRRGAPLGDEGQGCRGGSVRSPTATAQGARCRQGKDDGCIGDDGSGGGAFG
jgi:hypothetical protein